MTAVTGVAEDTPASTVKLALLEAEVNRAELSGYESCCA